MDRAGLAGEPSGLRLPFYAALPLAAAILEDILISTPPQVLDPDLRQALRVAKEIIVRSTGMGGVMMVLILSDLAHSDGHVPPRGGGLLAHRDGPPFERQRLLRKDQPVGQDSGPCEYEEKDRDRDEDEDQVADTHDDACTDYDEKGRASRPATSPQTV